MLHTHYYDEQSAFELWLLRPAVGWLLSGRAPHKLVTSTAEQLFVFRIESLGIQSGWTTNGNILRLWYDDKSSHQAARNFVIFAWATSSRQLISHTSSRLKVLELTLFCITLTHLMLMLASITTLCIVYAIVCRKKMKKKLFYLDENTKNGLRWEWKC